MTCLCEVPSPSRRAILVMGGALFAWAHLPKLASASNSRDPRLVVIVLRGALDGLSAVAPIGDPAYAPLHGQLALSLSGDHPALPLDGFFALNPAMPVFARLYKERSHMRLLPPIGSARTLTGRTCLKAASQGPVRSSRGGSIVPSRLCPKAIASRPRVASPLVLLLRLSCAGLLLSLGGHLSTWQRPRTTSRTASWTCTRIAIRCLRRLWRRA